MMKKQLFMTLLSVVLVAMTIGIADASSADRIGDVIDFSPEQITALADTVEEHSDKLQAIVDKLETTVDELMAEAIKDEGPEVPKKVRKDPKKIDKLVRELSSLTGEILKAKTEYLLKAKDVLTPEQKKKLIADLDYRVDFFDGKSPFLFQLDDLAEILELNTDQVKSVIRYRTDMVTKELKLKMEMAFLVLDIKEILALTDRKPGDIDGKVMKLADMGATLLDNRIDYILKARNVLTKPQKQELHHLVLLNLQAFSLMN